MGENVTLEEFLLYIDEDIYESMFKSEDYRSLKEKMKKAGTDVEINSILKDYQDLKKEERKELINMIDFFEKNNIH